ncbi:non-lysosomal glucosylceramidase [Tamlana sp. 62-3]|uniref:Non-lysosomal glucosylceramidase n=1 Tax=Neotamlana sargassicola TaxID=2883125 RepID=A0A9X1I4X3_9FLAO|nr:GH116 family glycosyl-hydrolase [Tamlana sargassicola]MCB4807857.1 non-lysosomal glucosylceramidase [Tamlana sargassicola]
MKNNIYIALVFLCTIFVVNGQEQENKWPVLKTYKGEYLTKVAMPLGGIGTGTVSLGGRGDLRDWEIANQGALGWKPVFNSGRGGINIAPFFAIRTKATQGDTQIRLLEGPLSTNNLDGDWGSNELNSGFPRFGNCEFQAAYPLAKVQLSDENSPVKVTLKAFNPMVPGDTKTSSMPTAILKYVVKNKTNEAIETTVLGAIPNFIGTDGWGGTSKGNKNTFKKEQNFTGIFMENKKVDTLNGKWGTMALTTPETKGVSYRTQWSPRLGWNGSLIDFWDDINDNGELEERKGEYPGNKPATLAIKAKIPANSTKEFVFVLTWNFPYRLAWEAQFNYGEHPPIKNHYATVYNNAWDVAKEVIPNLPVLEKRTVKFVNAFVDTDVPEVIKEAALFNVANLRSQTVFRDEDGYTFGWEGTGSVKGIAINPKGAAAGWGFGSCTHVWNYEVTTPFLFGDVAMSMREVEFKYATDLQTGNMAHRVRVPIKTEEHSRRKDAADGQLGCLMKMYREWQLSGDDKKLKELYPYIKAAMEFAWKDSGWDKDANGVLEGKHHNTMDVNYIGPNPQMQTWYLGALRATEEMALKMNDKAFAKKCRAIFKSGSDWTDKNLFNSEYYIQKVPKPTDYQIGEGILVDQLVGQYMAHICDLGYLLDKNNMKTTLKTIKKYNWKEDFNNHLSTFRSYAVGNEKGLIMGYYPKGKREARPFPYYSEVMTGFEYSTGAHMLYEGMEKDGLEVFTAVRNRYDGKKRNPFNEGEFGHRYARAMASYSGLLAYTGFHFSAVEKSMEFTSKSGKYFWSNGYSWGTCQVKNNEAIVTVLSGKIELKSFTLNGIGTKKLKGKVIDENESYTIKL